ncbi:hypothetical protein N7519_000711 [Penicillium mononematosum]|uniref:uncharacterized protein n=1 Tax=Penicillium mononematosum TaxID=268346 RepID=UPI002547FEFD|nr:uncharacterized protein N7519_000711 [Penicillium mononematosum]KAJ6190690.1 hypothetical protein N7519_000711 [Penicillium mononematosum]
MEYCTRRLFQPRVPRPADPTPESDGTAIELNNLPPLPVSGSTPDLLDSPVPDSGSPTLVPNPPLPPRLVISGASKPLK